MPVGVCSAKTVAPGTFTLPRKDEVVSTSASTGTEASKKVKIEERRNNFKQQILRLYNMETNELQKLCESVVEKCIHNQKTILSLEIPDEQLISKLER